MSAKKVQVVEDASVQVEEKTIEQNVVELSEKKVAEVSEYVQTVKSEVKSKIETIVAKFPIKIDDLIVLKDALKAELSHLVDDVSETSKTFKTEIAEISGKHKAHLIAEFKRSKGQTVEAFQKITSVADKEPSAKI